MKKILKIVGSIFVVFIGIFVALVFLVGDDEDDATRAPHHHNESSGSASGASEERIEQTMSNNSTSATPTTYPVNSNHEVDWVMYWYLCGSDLESEWGAASSDLEEMMMIDLPENVQIVIQTGGANDWQNNYVEANATQRYLYDYTGLTLLEELPESNMGEVDTLASFLQFANSNFPANKVMINLWNHGGGSLTGIAFDEKYGFDALTLPELYEAFTTVYTEDSSNPPIDIIGFDACLMATLDTAYIFSDLAKYMVASEELEPALGWNYTGLAGAMADDPDILPVNLGIAICDSYYEACEDEDMEQDITLSVVDLAKVGGVISAFDQFGITALETATNQSNFFNELGKVAKDTENYGGNNRRDGYTNMLDLGDFALQMSDMMPTEADNLFHAVGNSVVYAVNGPLRSSSYGLATYYYYDNDVDYFYEYTSFAPSMAVVYLYEYGLTGSLDEEAFTYIDTYANMPVEEEEEEDTYDSTPIEHGEYVEIATIVNSAMDFEDFPIYFDDDACAVLDLGPEAYDHLSAIGFELYYADYDADIMLFLGTDNDIIGDWDNCIFKDNFRGVWGSIDGNICYMELGHEGDDYNSYTVPVLLNGENYNLDVIYDFNEEEYSIYGARKAVSEAGFADKNLRFLRNGDVIETIHYATSLSSDDEDLYEVVVDSIVVDDNTSFYEEDMGDGVFIMMYTMHDAMGNVATSEAFVFEVEGDMIWALE
ncbi:MAG: clostripain-related cysteine peptidase [Bacillota bacterium]